MDSESDSLSLGTDSEACGTRAGGRAGPLALRRLACQKATVTDSAGTGIGGNRPPGPPCGPAGGPASARRSGPAGCHAGYLATSVTASERSPPESRVTQWA